MKNSLCFRLVVPPKHAAGFRKLGMKYYACRPVSQANKRAHIRDGGKRMGDEKGRSV